jgi:hypothetical protein
LIFIWDSLCLLTDQVLPTSSDDGLVEYVPSMPLSKVLSEHRTIHKYLAQWQSEPHGKALHHQQVLVTKAIDYHGKGETHHLLQGLISNPYLSFRHAA